MCVGLVLHYSCWETEVALMTLVRLRRQQLQDQRFSFQTVCVHSVLCVQTLVWLPVFPICLHTEVDACVSHIYRYKSMCPACLR